MAELQAELDKERMMNAKRTEKVRQYEEVNEKYIYENKNIKIKLKEYEESQNVEKQLT